MSIREKNANGAGQPNPDAGAALGKPPKLRWRHALARDWYLFKVDLHLDGRVPTRIRKRILADLRNSIDSDAGSSSLKEVLEGLGKPSELAASYAEGADQTRPLWTAGLVAALCMLMVYWFFLFTFTFGMLAVAMQAGGEFHSHFLPVKVMAFSGGDGVGIGWTGDAAVWFPVAPAAIAFIPASRAWRMFGHHG